MPSDAEITRLRQLIRRVEHDLDALDDNDRRQIEEAVAIVRGTRQPVQLGPPTTSSPALDPNLEGQRPHHPRTLCTPRAATIAISVVERSSMPSTDSAPP